MILSSSYPHMDMAQRLGLSYADVLLYADYMQVEDPTPQQEDAAVRIYVKLNMSQINWLDNAIIEQEKKCHAE